MEHNKLRLLMCLAVATVMPAHCLQSATTPRTDTARQEIIDLERQAKEAAISRDATFSERTLSDDYVAISPLGQIINKTDTITARKSGQLRYERIDVTDMVVRIFGNTAVVTARADVQGRDLGEEFSGPYRYTRIWVKRNGRWQTVSYQATVTR